MTNNVTRLPTPPPPGGGIPQPRDLDAEKQVLGAMLTNPRAATAVTQSAISGRDFWTSAHEDIYDAIATRTLLGHPVDPTLIADDLGKNLERAGGLPYLHELIASCITTANVTYHADIVRARSDERNAINAAANLIATIDQRGDTPLPQLIEQTREQLAAVPTRTSTDTSTWEPIDLAALLSGDIPDIQATVGPRRDGQCLLYPAAVHSISGEPGSGKTWFAQVIAAHELKQGRPVLYIDFEDRPTTIIGRLRSLGVIDAQIHSGLRYIRPDAAMTPAIRDNLSKAAQDVTYAVIDGITEAMTLHGLSLMDNEDVARWLHLLPRRLADLGCAVLQIDHVVKNSEQRGRYAIGGQHKLAGIDGAAYKILVVKPFGKGAYGRAKIVVDKDRHGDIATTGSTAADLHIDGRGDQVVGWLDDPTEDHAPDGTWRPTGYMAKIARVVETTPGISTNAICSSVRGKREHLMHAIQQLVNEGYVRVERGPRGGAHHYLTKQFEEAEDDAF